LPTTGFFAPLSRQAADVKPIFQKLTVEPEEGFAFRQRRAAGFDCPWHVHPEYELILVLQSDGYRIVGDSIAPLSAGDMVFVGPGLPHIWQNESVAGEPRPVHALLIQFERGFLGDGLLRLPALEPIRRFLDRSARGLHIVGATRDHISTLMAEMIDLKGLERVLQFLKIFGVLAASEDCHPIASPTFASDTHLYDQERMNQVFQFLNKNISQTIRLPDVARIANMSEGAFSRFFRLHTGKTFPEFLNELRVGRACRFLVEDDKNVTEVGYECGFTNLSNFNRQFLKLKGLSPSAFRRQMQRKIPDYSI
jgi:AraC-like DNA-binding protein/quercetin dioxygenase-like cupin family protein